MSLFPRKKQEEPVTNPPPAAHHPPTEASLLAVHRPHAELARQYTEARADRRPQVGSQAEAAAVGNHFLRAGNDMAWSLRQRLGLRDSGE